MGKGPSPGTDPALDRDLVSRLQAGDEEAFRQLVAAYQDRLRRLARSFSRSESVIEEAVQETWLAVVRGIGSFEGRGSLQSWIFSILVNQTRRLATREKRAAQVEKLDPESPAPRAPYNPDDEDEEPGMGPKGRWQNPPIPWGLEDPESFILREETLRVVETTLETMPEAQRQVVLLCDVEGLGAEEACNILGVSGTNQRVLLHRGRARIRRALDSYIGPDSSRPSQRKGKGR